MLLDKILIIKYYLFIIFFLLLLLFNLLYIIIHIIIHNIHNNLLSIMYIHNVVFIVNNIFTYVGFYFCPLVCFLLFLRARILYLLSYIYTFKIHSDY